MAVVEATVGAAVVGAMVAVAAPAGAFLGATVATGVRVGGAVGVGTLSQPTAKAAVSMKRKMVSPIL